MPFPAYSDRAGWQARLVARVRAGERPSVVCREAGWPSWDCFKVWARQDAGFAAALGKAQAVGAMERRFAYDAAAADAFLARVAAGEPLRALLGRPGMPSQRQYAAWRGWWFHKGGVDRLAAARAAGKAARARARRQGRHGRYRPYDAAVGERIYVRMWMGGASLRAILRSEPEFPSLSVLARWRREQPEFDAMLRFVIGAWRRKKGVRGAYSPELAEAVLDGIVLGGSLRSLGEREDLPCAGTLYNWVRTRPRFAEAVAQACVDREDIYADAIMEAAMRVDVSGVKAARARIGALKKQLTRLRKRPGSKGRSGRG